MSRRERGQNAPVADAFRRAMFWAIVGALANFSVADLNPVYFVLSFSGLLVCWYGSVKPARPAPRLAINTVLMLVIAFAAIEMLRVGVGVSAFAVFVVLLLIVKLLDLRSARDDAQILVLCLSIMVAAVLTSNSFLTGLFMIIESVLLLRVFVLFQLHSVVSLGPPRRPRLAKPARVDMRSMLIATGFLCALIGSIVFVVLPRNIGGQAFGDWGGARSVSGFADEVELGRPGLISTSTKPVLDMTISDRNGMNLGGENTPPVYLRGAVLEIYESGNWTRNSIIRVPLTERIRRYPANSSLRPRGGSDNSVWDMQCRITMRAVNDGPVFLFSPWRPVEFRVGDRPMRLGYDFTRGLFLKDGIGGSLEYTVRVVRDEFRPMTIDEDATRSPVINTDIHPDVARLAADIIREGGIEPDPSIRPIEDDEAAVRLLENFLRSRYTYTLDVQPVPAGQDATRWFLFDRQTGHCEYYASSIALLARSVGIPARVVTGYIASDYNPVTEQYTVRESNAHAWTEAEIAPGQWRIFDGTPPSDFYDIHVPSPGLMRTLSRMYESIEFIWGRTVVGYDANARESIIGQKLGDFGLARLADRLLERLAAGRVKLVSRAALVALIVFATSFFLGILIIRYQRVFAAIREAIRTLIARTGIHQAFSTGDKDPLGPLEHAINRTLDHAGLNRPEWMPLKSHLHAVHEQLDESPELRTALHDGTRWLYRHRFATGETPEITQMGGIIERLRQSEKTAQSRKPNRDDTKPTL